MREIPASPSAVFRGVSYLLHPGHEYELGPSRSGIWAWPISYILAPWATVSCCSGSSHCSALCNYSRVQPTAALLFLRERYSSSFVPRTFLFLGDTSCCSTCVSLAVVLPGAKVALEQPSSSTSLAISPKSLSDSDMSIFLLSIINCVLPVDGQIFNLKSNLKIC